MSKEQPSDTYQCCLKRKKKTWNACWEALRCAKVASSKGELEKTCNVFGGICGLHTLVLAYTTVFAVNVTYEVLWGEIPGFEQSSNWKSHSHHFAVTFPVSCCDLIPNTCANKQEEMQEETPLSSSSFQPCPSALALKELPKAWKRPKSSGWLSTTYYITYLEKIRSVHQACPQTIQKK